MPAESTSPPAVPPAAQATAAQTPGRLPPRPSSPSTLDVSCAATLTDDRGAPGSGSNGPLGGFADEKTVGEPVVVSFETPGLAHFNPRSWSHGRRFLIASQASIQMFSVTLGTSIYVASYPGLRREFGVSTELATAGLSTFTLALGVGSLFWAPLSETAGRKPVLVSSLTLYVLFGLGPVLGHNIETLVITRFFMGFCGSSIMSNSPGALNDLYDKHEIGLAMSLNSISPFLGPVLGPLIGGYVSMYAGDQSWRWVNSIPCMLAAAVVLVATLTVPETYPGVILQREARRLEKETGRPHVSIYDHGQPKKTALRALAVGLRRPFVFLFLEPIVLLLSIYTSLVFGVLYLFFAGLPIIYQEDRGWSQGVGALPFLAMAVGLFFGVPVSLYTIGLYRKAAARSPDGRAPPEERLYFAMFAAILLVVSLLWFAFTVPAHIPWPASVVALFPFGLGLIGMMTSIMSFLSDTYTIYSASVFAANSLLRYVFGAVFPLFGSFMFHNLTPRWALFLLAMICLLLAPMPFLFFRYGARIRSYSKHVPRTTVPLPPTAKPSVEGDLERQVSEPALFLTQGDRAVRVEELQEGIAPPPGQAQDLARLDGRHETGL